MLTLALDPLDKKFVLGKPIKQEDYDEKIIYELEKCKHLLITRKRDGWKLFVVKANGKFKIYTDGINDITDRLPHCVRELQTLSIPDHSLFACEGILDSKGKDNFSKVGSILNIKVSTGVALQRQAEIGRVKLMFFETVVWDCTDLSKKGLNLPYVFGRLWYLQRILRSGDLIPEYLMPAQVLRMSYNRAKKEAVKRGWEGLVLYDTAFGFSFRLDGKDPERPKGCYKWKPIHEDDFIVRYWFGDDDKHPREVKKVLLSQIDSKTGKEFDCGKLGSFTEEMRKRLLNAKYPLVMQVRFEHRHSNGKLRNARFMRLRSDKKVKDCVAPRNCNPVE